MPRKVKPQKPTGVVVCARCDTLVDRAGWERHAVECERKNQDKILARVAREYLGIALTDEPVADPLEVHEVGPNAIKAALLAAYRAGYLERRREIP